MNVYSYNNISSIYANSIFIEYSYIYPSAFSNLQNLKSVTICSVFGQLYDNCFSGCSNLAKVIFSDASSPISINSGAFSNCNQLKSISIGRSISSSNFPGWTNLNQITITKNDVTLPYSLFSECSMFLELKFAAAVSSIAANSYKSWTKLNSITFLDSSNSISIGSDAFLDCAEINTLIIERPVSFSNFPGWINLKQVTLAINEIQPIFIAFSDCNSVFDLILTSSVSSISESAFQSIPKLNSVTFSDSLNLISIGSDAFSDCIGLQILTIKRPISFSNFPGWINLSQVTISINEIQPMSIAFSECKSVFHLILASTVSSLSENSFQSIPKLSSVTFSDSLNPVSIGVNAFNDCNILNSISIGRPISSLQFPGWNNINQLTITNNNFASSYSVFAECNFIDIDFASKVTNIPENAFKSWINFKTFTIPPSITELGKTCFAECSNLVSVIFEDGSKSIKFGSGVFANCMILKTLKLGRPILPTSSFPNWTKLNRIIITNDAFTMPHVAFFDCVRFPEIEIASGVTIIRDNPHNQWANVTTIEIHDSSNPLFIDANIFENSEMLNSLKIGRPINSIEFPGWKKLSSITVTSNDFASPFSVFADCDSVSNLVFTSSVTMLNTNAFNSWNVFKAFTVPSSITVLKRGCFAGCSNLVSLTFAESKNPISIEADAFTNCEKLTSIVIGRPIESAIFPGWTNVNKILITSETFTASHEIFDECTFDTDIEFAPNVHNLGFALFYSWANLKSIIIPSTVKSIVASCFINCMSLESVTFAETPSKISIETNAFDGCDMLETVTIGRPISSNEFPGWSNLELAIITSNYFEAPFIVFSECKNFPGMYFDKSVSSIRPNAFKSWQNLSFLANSTAMLNIERIGSSAFRGASSIEVNLIHCTGLQSIGEFAFAEMPNLLKVSLPPKTSIGVGCFANCPILSDVSLPSHLSEISDSSFENCERIVSIAIPPSIFFYINFRN